MTDPPPQLTDLPTIERQNHSDGPKFPTLIVANDPALVFVRPSPGPMPPGPYCRWQDRFSAALVRDQIESHHENLLRTNADPLRSDAGPPVVAVLSTWSIAWNEDPQPLLVMRQLRDEGLIAAIVLAGPANDPNCVVPLMRSGLLDAVLVSMTVSNQAAAASILPTALETETIVIASGAIDHLPSDPIMMALRQHRLDDIYSPAEAAIAFLRSHKTIESILIQADQIDLFRSAITKPDLPLALIDDLRRCHGS